MKFNICIWSILSAIGIRSSSALFKSSSKSDYRSDKSYIVIFKRDMVEDAFNTTRSLMEHHGISFEAVTHIYNSAFLKGFSIGVPSSYGENFLRTTSHDTMSSQIYDLMSINEMVDWVEEVSLPCCVLGVRAERIHNESILMHIYFYLSNSGSRCRCKYSYGSV